jgi:hypothetical protein
MALKIHKITNPEGGISEVLEHSERHPEGRPFSLYGIFFSSIEDAVEWQKEKWNEDTNEYESPWPDRHYEAQYAYACGYWT